MRTILSIAVAAGMFGLPAHAGEILDAVKKRGELVCGVSEGIAGFSAPDSQGTWSGMDVDFCHAMAAAIFGDSSKVTFKPLSAQNRFTAVQSGEVDVLSRVTTYTLTRDTSLGLDFGAILFYDGQGFMVPASMGISSAKDLSGATICMQTGTTNELNVADFFRSIGKDFKPLAIEDVNELNNAFFTSKRCDVYTGDTSGMAAWRSSLASNQADYTILPELISKEPLAAAVRHGDQQFSDILRWVGFALIEAEEKGVTQSNLESMKTNPDPSIQALLGTVPGNGKALGLDEAWAYNAIKAVGNYGEIFERNVGKGTPLGLDRGMNALWNKGGLLYAPPAR
ncbi:amino acid ABC transporter substrate-binding protein [Rhizobium sp. BK176]|uniref:amino acid ABC transporter substrate-binding protein n=1 Tax=Rhizobium sp. BK176 TaxID=2587071 RepID=UPI002169B1F6|nr:amino acid ABC transporter substrate-binding protein [Rhizobium sp. BK176]MCS4093722.1 general L-amino acid transport system substrate-binding protein [Rhizobium sp. BK176]